MRQVQASTFRTTFGTYDEPVEVMKYQALLGTWYPRTQAEENVNGVVDFALEEQATEIEALQAEVKQLKRLLAEREVPTIKDPGFGHSRPAPKPGRK